MTQPQTTKPKKQTAKASDARILASRVLDRVMHRGQRYDAAIAAEPELVKLEARDRAWFQELVFTVLRHGPSLDAVLRERLKQWPKPKDRAVLPILRIGAAELCLLGTPAHAVVDQAVLLTRARKLPHMAGMVNAVLRRVEREKPEVKLPAAQHWVPDWMWQSWVPAYGEVRAQQLAGASMQKAPLDITVKSNPSAWAEQLDGMVLPGGTVRLVESARVEALPGFDEGEWWVQDVAAALPVRLLGDLTGQRVLEIGAAPGGKTAQLAFAGANVVALDRSRRRLERLEDNQQRLGFTAELVCADAMEYQPEQTFDGVVVDAPCTATGTMRRHPDLVYGRDAGSLERLQSTQRRMLAKAAELVRDGGWVLYLTCSLQPEEGEEQVTAFLEAHQGWKLASLAAKGKALGLPEEWLSPEGYLRCLPTFLADEGGMDGFFAAMLVKDGATN